MDTQTPTATAQPNTNEKPTKPTPTWIGTTSAELARRLERREAEAAALRAEIERRKERQSDAAAKAARAARTRILILLGVVTDATLSTYTATELRDETQVIINTLKSTSTAHTTAQKKKLDADIALIESYFDDLIKARS